jgi:intein/homing endonuclease
MEKIETIIGEYIKTNAYQTPVTEELKNSLHKEVWQDMMEFIESVQFISWLIQPESIRGHAKDRPKETEFYNDGRIDVSITKPHILENMEFFRERALYYEKHGRYTHLRPNPNPKSEYAQFWKEELKRWRNGLVRESDGEWIPGGYYFYLNYSPIWVNKEAVKSVKGSNKKVKGDRKKHFPNVWLGDYLFFHYLEQAKNSGSHGKMLKTRGVGASYKLASLSPRNMYVEPGLPNFHLASDKSFLDGEKGVYGKVLDVLDWIAESTPLPKMRLINSPRAREVQLGYADEYGVKKGLKSSVYGISLKDNPDKARGVRGPLIHYEEDGLFPDLEKAWSVNRKAVEDGDIVYGQMVALGTGGCLTSDNKVFTNTGDLVKISDVDINNGIIGFDLKNKKISKEDITYWQPETYKDCVKITTNSGRWIECSNDHPIYSSVKSDCNEIRIFNWNEASNLDINNLIAIADEVNVFGENQIWNPRLLGLLIGDGSYGEKQSPNITSCDKGVIDFVKNNFITKVYTTRPTSNGGTYENIGIKNIRNNLRELGIYGQTGLNKRLPVDIFKSSKKDVCELIGGLFDTDGCIMIKNYKKRNSFSGELCLTSSSDQLLQEVQLLLQKLGIHGHIRFVKPRLNKTTKIKDVNGWYNLIIADKDSIIRFADNISLLVDYKQDRLNQIKELISKKNTLRKDRGFRFEKIVKIEKVGIKRVYNLTANQTHTYLGNGIITHNTEGADFEGSEKLFRNPLAYNIYGIPNVFDKNSNGESVCGFFWGAYLNRARCYDETNGEPDIIKSLIEILNDRFIVKYNSSDPAVITQKLAEEPITPSEAVMRTSGTIFPVSDLKDYRDTIRIQGERYFDAHYVGELVMTVKGVEWKPSTEVYPIRRFPTGTDKPEGAVEIFEMPKTDHKGQIDPMRYIGGIDPVDDDASGTNSLACIRILDLYTDRVVAEFTGRPKFANDFYEICRRMLMFYNARANYENDKKGLFAYFDLKRCLHLLCDTPQILKDMDYVKGSAYGNKSKGTNSGKMINAWGRRLQKDWLITPAYQQEYDEDGNQVGEKLNMHCERGIAYIEELIAWNIEINADRVSAMGMLMIYRADRLKYLASAKENKEEDDTDEYLDENFKNAFIGQNSYEKWTSDF